MQRPRVQALRGEYQVRAVFNSEQLLSGLQVAPARPSIFLARLSFLSPRLFDLLRPLALCLIGRRVPAGTAELRPMLAGGTFVVAQGGGTSAINYHVAHQYMRSAADFLGVGPGGRHARGLMPADPACYAIFGAQVLAPLNGVVTLAQDGRPDLRVPDTDTLRPAGNHVQPPCTLPDNREVHVLLGHLQEGSVQVQVGQGIHAGQILGRVGNSGNTTEPHLHLGVNRGVTPGQPLSGEGVPFTVQGRFPVRGMLFRQEAQSPGKLSPLRSPPDP